MIETHSLDLAAGIQRMAMMLMLDKAEQAIVKATDTLRNYRVDESQVPTTEPIRKHQIPFELVNLETLDKTLDFLYTNKDSSRTPRRAPPSSFANRSIQIITTDGSQMLLPNEDDT